MLKGSHWPKTWWLWPLSGLVSNISEVTIVSLTLETFRLPINSSFFFVSLRIWCQDQEHAAIPAHCVESLWGDASTITDGEESISWSKGIVQILGTSWSVEPLRKWDKIETSDSYNKLLFWFILIFFLLLFFSDKDNNKYKNYKENYKDNKNNKINKMKIFKIKDT